MDIHRRGTDLDMPSRPLARAALAAFAVALVAVAAGCGGGDDGPSVPEAAPAEAKDFATEWPAPNGNYSNTRVATTEISADNVDELGVAWSVPIDISGSFGVMAATPIVADGVVYAQDIRSNVMAIDFESGVVKWTKAYDSPTVGPNGLTIGYGKIFGATGDSAFALDAETGEEVWKTDPLVRNAREGIDMAPAVFDDTVYVSTVPGNPKSFYAGNGAGVLWALDQETGQEKWKFATVPENLWSDQHTKINSGGGLWHPPAFSDDGDVFISVANPAPFLGTKEFPWATSRPGPNLYTNSVVKLDRETGELQWYYQALPHDVYDWDLHLPPVLAETGGDEVVVAGGKMGYVYVVDAEDGTLVWKKPVGKHNGHDDDHELAAAGDLSKLPELPLTILPGILGGVETQMAVTDDTIYAPVVNNPTTFTTQEKSELGLTGGTGELTALDLESGDVRWTHEFDTPPYGAATVANDLVFTTTFDGTLVALDRDSGNVAWEQQLPAGTNSTIAIVGDTIIAPASFPQGKGQSAQIVAYRLGATGDVTTTDTTETTPGEASGEDVFTTSCGSCHTLAAAGTTGQVGPNLDQNTAPLSAIEEQVRNGGGGMPAFEGQLSDQQIDAVAQYVFNERDPNAEGGGGGGP
jgi:outer membrane protein assembly factor BamB